MRLLGVLDLSFGNFITLRGLASIKDLAKISIPDVAYQRDLNSKHGEAMQDFFNAGKYTFFPEVILALDLPSDEKYSDKVNKLFENVPHTSGTYQFDSFKIGAFTKKFISEKDARSFDYFCRGELTPSKDFQLKRIDGNHRLSVAEGVNDKKIPFCIIFLKENTKKTQRVLFNNINFKTIPLTSEENLRLIFEQEGKDSDVFSDEELKDPIWFGPEYIKARELFHSISLTNLDQIQSVLQKKGKDEWMRTFILELTLIYCDDITPNKLKNALQKCDQLFKEFGEFQDNLSYQLLIVYCYYELQERSHSQFFHLWVKENHIYELQNFDHKGLIAIFDKVIEAKRRTIFLAMPFCDDAKQNYEAIKGAIKALNQQRDESLKLELIRIDKNKVGYSFTITDQILKHIEAGGYLIADISLGNQNVYYEIGYQMGLNRGKNREQNNFLLVHNKGVAKADFDKDKSFNISGISIEAATDSNDLKEKIEKQLTIYYGINYE
ncbi:hypothetical protein P0082_01675 [Candidatus Haliotispira prima]|uniref:DGQHR domain-containing protein n=1 Tax=Candidatus Haliotispira prima TaxID=3034016 RepID=A0ABY8MIE4_9SPIO|nr:hypothetical protein P0082_01675 [Candidatus Haliotispira prima]